MLMLSLQNTDNHLRVRLRRKRCLLFINDVMLTSIMCSCTITRSSFYFIVKRHLSTKTRNLSNKLDIPLISFRAYHPKEAQMVQDIQVDKIPVYIIS